MCLCNLCYVTKSEIIWNLCASATQVTWENLEETQNSRACAIHVNSGNPEETQTRAYATCVTSGNLKQPKTYVPVQPVLPQQILKKTQNFGMDDTLDLDRFFEVS